MANESLTLKWGTLKGWNFQPDGPAFALLQKYHEGDVSLSAATQNDDDAQHQLILDIIDAVDTDQIKLDWEGTYVSKEEAKQYVINYRK